MVDLSDKDQVFKVIIETLPREFTDAIYVFGSYRTEDFNINTSDIDIAWFTSYEDEVLRFEKFIDYEKTLTKLLGIKVDLVDPEISTKLNLYLITSILSFPPISETSEKFDEWFDRSIDQIGVDWEFDQLVLFA